MPVLCPACGLIVDAGGHSAGSEYCLKRQLAAAKARIAELNTELAIEKEANANQRARITDLHKLHAETLARLTDESNKSGRLLREAAERDELLAKICRMLAVSYGLTVACDKCGAPAMAPCISDSGRITVHSTRATKAVAEIPAAPAPNA